MYQDLYPSLVTLEGEKEGFISQLVFVWKLTQSSPYPGHPIKSTYVLRACATSGIWLGEYFSLPGRKASHLINIGPARTFLSKVSPPRTCEAMFYKGIFLTLIKSELDSTVSAVSKKKKKNLTEHSSPDMWSVRDWLVAHQRVSSFWAHSQTTSPDTLYLGGDVGLALANGMWREDIPFGWMWGSANCSLLAKFGWPPVFGTQPPPFIYTLTIAAFTL